MEYFEYIENFLSEDFKEDKTIDEKTPTTFRKYIMKDLLWENDPKIVVFGKEVRLPREQTAYGDEGLTYRYSGKTLSCLEWTDTLRKIKDYINDKFNLKLNFVLVNYYKDGSNYIGYHSDDEKDLDPGSPIVSLSFGATRRFLLKDKQSKEVIEFRLKNNSCIIMKPGCQKKYKHSVPKEKNVTKSRLNLTFRRVK